MILQKNKQYVIVGSRKNLPGYRKYFTDQGYKVYGLIGDNNTEVLVFLMKGRIGPAVEKEIEMAYRGDHSVHFFDVTSEDPFVFRHLAHCPTDKLPNKGQLMAPKDFAAKIKEKFGEISKRLKEGEFIEDFSEELDELLGTKMEERDRTIENDWENQYREEPT